MVCCSLSTTNVAIHVRATTTSIAVQRRTTHTMIVSPDSNTLSMRPHLTYIPVNNKAGIVVPTSNVNVQFLVYCRSRSAHSADKPVVGMSVFLGFLTVSKVDLHDLVFKCYRSFFGHHGELGQSGHEKVYICLVPEYENKCSHYCTGEYENNCSRYCTVVNIELTNMLL